MAPIIVWFRQDLRLSDNQALHFAAQSDQRLICLYVLDEETPGPWRGGGASRWWLHHSLTALSEALSAKGGSLVLRRGRADTAIRRLVHETRADTIVWNRCYEPFAVARDTSLKNQLTEMGLTVQSFNGALLFEPWEVATGDGKPYRVFTPFWRAMRAKTEPGKPQAAPRKLQFHKTRIASDDLKD